MFLSDYPRALANSLRLWWFPALDALAVAPALAVAFLLALCRLALSCYVLSERPPTGGQHSAIEVTSQNAQRAAQTASGGGLGR